MTVAAKLGGVLACCALAVAANCQPLNNGQRSLKQQLSRDGFSGSLTGRVHLTQLGTLHCATQQYRVLYYEWEESSHPGKAIHATQRLLFLDNADHYLGSYTIADRPVKVTSDAVVFASTTGNRIGCSDVGIGKRVLLDGELEEFFK